MTECDGNLFELLEWARTKRSRAYIEIFCDGSAEVQMEYDDFCTRYEGNTLLDALTKAKRCQDRRDRRIRAKKASGKR